MTELLTAAQMRAIEKAAIALGEVTGLELMERAGRGVVEAIFEEWPELAGPGGGAAPDPAHRQERCAFGADDLPPEDRPGAPHPPGYLDNEEAAARRAVILCGPGNNGGDGFVVARLLKERGWEVEVFLYGEPSRLPPDARVNYERWLGMGGVGDSADFDPWARDTDVFIDAIFGNGISRAPVDEVRTFLDKASSAASLTRRRSVALDLPSGLCGDSGRVLGIAPPADLTVTFGYMKRGHFLGEGAEYCGRVVCREIGLQKNAAQRGLGKPYDKEKRTKADYSALVNLVDDESIRPGFSDPTSRLDKAWMGSEQHKYSHGHALILSGPTGRTGAARLAARGALRIGAGLVTVGCPPEAVPENAARLDAVMLRVVADGHALAEALADPRINALCLGPGLGLDERARGLLAVALESRAETRPADPVGRASARLARRLVLDADALTVLSQSPDLFAALHEGCVLTPHAGEFARLFPDIAERLAAPATKGPAYSKVDATREAAARAGCVVLYKGPDTVIADPSGQCSINSAQYERAAPWLATAGSGDVLSGFITGLLARGFTPMEAAETGAWLHVECARNFGPGLIAEDLPEELPAVFRGLGL